MSYRDSSANRTPEVGSRKGTGTTRWKQKCSKEQDSGSTVRQTGSYTFQTILGTFLGWNLRLNEHVWFYFHFFALSVVPTSNTDAWRLETAVWKHVEQVDGTFLFLVLVVWSETIKVIKTSQNTADLLSIVQSKPLLVYLKRLLSYRSIHPGARKKTQTSHKALRLMTKEPTSLLCPTGPQYSTGPMKK